MTGKDVVREVICLFQGGKRWTRGAFAKSATGREAEPTAEGAETFCLLGAGLKVLGCTQWNAHNNEAYQEYRALLEETVSPARFKRNGRSFGNGAVAKWNDRPTRAFEDVELVLTRTLARINRREKAAKKLAPQ